MDVKQRLIAGTINFYTPEDGWYNTHLDISDRPIYWIDKGGFVPVDVVANLAGDDFREKLDESGFDEIRCHQVFEHLTPEQAPTCLKNFAWALKSGGILDIEVPNIQKIIGGWHGQDLTWEDMVRNMYGSSSPTMQDDHYNAHRWGWNDTTLQTLLGGMGFNSIVNIDPSSYQLRLRAVCQ